MGGHLSAWPAHLQSRRGGAAGKNQPGGILRPVTAPGLNLPCRTGPVTVHRTNLRPERIRVALGVLLVAIGVSLLSLGSAPTS